MTYEPRTAALSLTLPIVSGLALARPQDVKLLFDQAPSIDVGITCYLRRRNVGKKREIDPESFCASRANKVRALLDLLSEMTTTKVPNVCGKIRGFLVMLTYCDEQLMDCPLTSAKAARAAVTAFGYHLEERVRLNTISSRAARAFRREALAILEHFHLVENLGQGVVLRVPKPVDNPTEPVDEVAQGKVLSLCSALFSGISELVLDKKPYPYKLAVPQYLGWADSFLWLFPAIKRIRPPWEPECRGARAIDYANGRLQTIKKLTPLFKFPCMAVRALTDMETALTAANSDFNNPRRWDAARQAATCFPLLFIAHVGMNAAQMRQLPWDGNFEVSPERQGFRTVKLRAGGRQVSFEIQPTFLALFRRYIDLREYVLKGRACPWLFFSCATAKDTPAQIGGAFLDNIQKHLRLIDKDLPYISARVWRACKSDWLLRNTDPATAALVLQTSLSTMLNSYAAGSKTTAMVEMSAYLNRVADKVLEAKDPTPVQPGPVGGCVAYGEPSEVPAAIRDKPNCKNPEGCLFCAQYRVHADERDTRKLLSCRSCIRQTASFSQSAEAFQDVFGPVLVRIDELLSEIRQREGGTTMVSKLEVEVDDGELDPYWSKKMELLINLGMLG